MDISRMLPGEEKAGWPDFSVFAVILRSPYAAGRNQGSRIFSANGQKAVHGPDSQMELIRTKGKSFWLSFKLGLAFLPSGVYFPNGLH